MIPPLEVLHEITSRIRSAKKFSFARFNDGEIGAILGVFNEISRGDETVSREMKTVLRRSLSTASGEIVVGLPCSTCYPRFAKAAKRLVPQDVRTCLATSIQNETFATAQNEIVKSLAESHSPNIVWFGSYRQNIGNVEALIQRSVKHYPLPAQQAFDEAMATWGRTRSMLSQGNAILLLSCGPAARAIAVDAARRRENIVAIDIGSLFDPITQDISHRYHLKPSPVCHECRGPIQPNQKPKASLLHRLVRHSK